MFSSTSTGFSVRKRKPRMRLGLVLGQLEVAHAACPRAAPARCARAPRARARWPRARPACRDGPVVCSFSMRFSTTPRSASTNSRSSCSTSRHGSTEPSGCATAGSSKARTTCSSSSAVRSRASWSAGISAGLASVRRQRRRRQVDVGHVGRDLALGLEHLGQLGQSLVRHLDHADVDGHAAEAAGLGLAAGERVENGCLARPGKPDDRYLHCG